MKIDSPTHISNMSNAASSLSKAKKKQKAFSVDSEAVEVDDDKRVTSSKTSQVQSAIFASLKNNKLINEALENGEKALNDLTQLQYQLLSGQLSHDNLMQLSNALENSQQQLDTLPQGAKNILSDIQVRLAVELEKHSKV